MLRRVSPFLVLLAVTAAVATAQNSSQDRITINVGFAAQNPADSRPRIVSVKTAAVKSSVVVNNASVERQAFDALNKKRVELGLKPLAWSDEVADVARLHSRNMAEMDFFSHRGKGGDLVSDRADSMRLGGWRAIGENIAFNRGYNDPVAKAVDSWLNSNSHRNNILGPDWRESAVGVAIAPDGSYYFTQVFLARK